MSNPTRKRFPFPSEVEGIPLDWKRYLKYFYDDIYSPMQSFTPVIANLSGGEVVGYTQRQGRIWLVSVTVSGDPSEASSSYLDLPFNVFATTAFNVSIGGSAYVLQNTNRLYLPDWNTSEQVIISGTAGE